GGGGRRHVVGEQVRHVEERAGLAVEGVGHRWVGVAERRDGEAAEEVEVALAIAVPQLGAPAAHEGDGRGGVGGHEHVDHLVTIVPMPESVKISRSSTWATRPSRMWARPTPWRTACTQAAIFGIMPPVNEPSATSRSSSSAVIWRMRLSGSPT